MVGAAMLLTCVPEKEKLNGFKSAGVTQLVECDLAKVDVAGSNPVSRSILSECQGAPPLKKWRPGGALRTRASAPHFASREKL